MRLNVIEANQYWSVWIVGSCAVKSHIGCQRAWLCVMCFWNMLACRSLSPHPTRTPQVGKYLHWSFLCDGAWWWLLFARLLWIPACLAWGLFLHGTTTPFQRHLRQPHELKQWFFFRCKLAIYYQSQLQECILWWKKYFMLPWRETGLWNGAENNVTYNLMHLKPQNYRYYNLFFFKVGAVVRAHDSPSASRFDSWTPRHMWVEFVASSCPCSKGFSRFSGFHPSTKKKKKKKKNLSKFQFNLNSVAE